MLNNICLLLVSFFTLERLYFFIARRFHIVDRPNARSSHEYLTIRGGGIIFPIAGIIMLNYANLQEIIFGISLLLISCLSFVDDIKNISSGMRLVIQSIAVLGLVCSFISELNWIWLPVLFILTIGIINAYNFMDGINGITVLYSIVAMLSLYWIHHNVHILQSDLFFLSVTAALLVFAFFNVRKKAYCFAGDVGSVAIAFIICNLLLQLILFTKWPYWILLLGIYGLDTVFTICCRILRKEPLVEAHRSHFYQYLANEAKWSHLQVCSLYAGAQLLFNIVIIYAYLNHRIAPIIFSLVGILIIYTIFRFWLEGRYRLFTAYIKN